MIRKPRAIFVGPRELGEDIAKRRPDWDFIAFPKNIITLWDGLNDRTIDNEVEIIITVDVFFKESGEDNTFANLVAVMSAYCLVLVLEYKPHTRAMIQERVERERYTSGSATDEPYFFIDVKRPNPSINDAVETYIKKTNQREIAAVLEGKDPALLENDVVQNVAPAEVINYVYDDEDDDVEDGKYLGQVVAVTSSKGGSGKSTVTTTLATYISHSSINSAREHSAERPLKIVILDLDVRDGQIGFLTGNMTPSVLHMRSKGINPETLAETVIRDDKLKVDLLLAPKRPRLSDDTPPEFYLELIQFLKKRYDYVFLDTSVNYLDPLLEKVAYPIADQIVFVTDIVVNSVYSMTRWIQEVTKPVAQKGMGIERDKIGIVVNKSMADVNMNGNKIAKSALNLPVLAVVPNNAKLFAHAANLQAMESVLKNQEIRKSFRMLARRVVGKKYPLSDNVI